MSPAVLAAWLLLAVSLASAAKLPATPEDPSYGADFWEMHALCLCLYPSNIWQATKLLPQGFRRDRQASLVPNLTY